MKKYKLILSVILFATISIVVSCSDYVEYNPIQEPQTYTLKFTNVSHECGFVQIYDSSGSKLYLENQHDSIVSEDFTTKDSLIIIRTGKIGQGYIPGVMYGLSDENYNSLGFGSAPDATELFDTININNIDTIRLRLFFYNTCPIPNEPGCPIPPDQPFTCPI